MGLLPMTALREASGVIGFMKAALGLRFAPDFFFAVFLAGFLAGAFLAGFLDFLVEDFFAAFAGFFAFFFAVAIVESPMKSRDRCFKCCCHATHALQRMHST